MTSLLATSSSILIQILIFSLLFFRLLEEDILIFRLGLYIFFLVDSSTRVYSSVSLDLKLARISIKIVRVNTRTTYFSMAAHF